MVQIYVMSLFFFFFFFCSFVMTCIAMSVQAELTKVPLRPYLRGNPGLLPRTISSRGDISVVEGVEDCKGQTGCLLKKDGVLLPELISIAPSSEFVNIAPLSDLVSLDRRSPSEALIDQKSEDCPENKYDHDIENDDDDDDGDVEDQDDDDDDGDVEDQDDDDDDDANDEDFSGEGGGVDDEGDHEEDRAANGNEGSDDDGDEEEDEDQPPAKKRK